jgi:hypothetical protein
MLKIRHRFEGVSGTDFLPISAKLPKFRYVDVIAKLKFLKG